MRDGEVGFPKNLKARAGAHTLYVGYGVRDRVQWGAMDAVARHRAAVKCGKGVASKADPKTSIPSHAMAAFLQAVDVEPHVPHNRYNLADLPLVRDRIVEMLELHRSEIDRRV